MSTIFNGQRMGECLDQFCERRVRPPEPELESFNSTVDKFVRFLHKEFTGPYTVEMVYKNGSLKKGTAVLENADVDLVVYIKEITNVHDLIKARPEILRQLKRNVANYVPWKGQIQFEGESPYSLYYKLNGNEVDLLPAFNALKHYVTPENIYEAMKRDARDFGEYQTGEEYSTSLSELQVKFVKPIPGYVKDVIRLLKQWNTDKGLGLRSYTLELLTIRAWKHLGGTTVGTPPIFREVMKMLSNYEGLGVSFDDNYVSREYLKLHNRPYVLDPANPYNNTLYGTRSWSKIVKEAEEALKRA